MSRVFDTTSPFPKLAKQALADDQLRANLRHATTTIRDKRKQVVAELPDWELLRDAGAEIKDYVLTHLDELVVELEKNVTERGGTVHWARDADEANDIVVRLVQQTGVDSVVKVKSMATAEIELNVALENNGITAYETDLAELIVQLGNDLPSHILVPAIHKNRSQIRQIFLDEMGKSGLPAPDGLTNEPAALAAAARAHLRDRFLSAKVGISGANFVIADSGALVVVESEGNGRMCLTLPETLISVVGVEKLLPNWQSLEVFLQLLPRSSTGERMNPYTSIFAGATPGNGPSNFHLVLLDNGRTSALAEAHGRDVLRCIRCSACLNVCPVYERTGGHAYGNPYPGPIGAVLVPQLRRGERTPLEKSLPYASSLCGACYDVCPVKIDIPKILVRLRSEVVDDQRSAHPHGAELTAMKVIDASFSSSRRFQFAVRAGSFFARVTHLKTLRHLPWPLSKWSASRNSPAPPAESFRQWFARTHPAGSTLNETITAPAPVGRTHHGATPEQTAASDNPTASARTGLLESLDVALAGQVISDEPTTRSYRTVGELTPMARREMLKDRLIDYLASVHEATSATLASVIADIVRDHGSHSVAVTTDLPTEWVAALNVPVATDEPELTTSQLDQIETTISGCAVAIAETGTIILDSGVAQGRRVLSLVPDHLLVVIDESQIVELVPEAVARLDATRAQTWISGPSATSDIELQRIEGVHGPRTLDVVIVAS